MLNTDKCALCDRRLLCLQYQYNYKPLPRHLSAQLLDYRPSLSNGVGEGTTVGCGVIIINRAGAATVVVFGSLHQNQPHDVQDVVVDVAVFDVKYVDVLEVVELVVSLSKQPAKVSY